MEKGISSDKPPELQRLNPAICQNDMRIRCEKGVQNHRVIHSGKAEPDVLDTIHIVSRAFSTCEVSVHISVHRDLRHMLFNKLNRKPLVGNEEKLNQLSTCVRNARSRNASQARKTGQSWGKGPYHPDPAPRCRSQNPGTRAGRLPSSLPAVQRLRFDPGGSESPDHPFRHCSQTVPESPLPIPITLATHGGSPEHAVKMPCPSRNLRGFLPGKRHQLCPSRNPVLVYPQARQQITEEACTTQPKTTRFNGPGGAFPQGLNPIKII